MVVLSLIKRKKTVGFEMKRHLGLEGKPLTTISKWNSKNGRLHLVA